MTDIQTMEVPPDASRIVESLRDTGYEFNTAIADIVDNSIAARATIIDIRLQLDFARDVILSIADDGHGMDKAALVNAMKYGSQRRGDPASLGKFGMGLKTASTAFSKRLSVASRHSSDGPVNTAIWDLDLIAATDKWELQLRYSTDTETSLIDSVSPAGAGTVVIWDNIDRFPVDHKNRSSKKFATAFQRVVDSLRDHLAMVFQRFLDAEDDRAPNIAILLNQERINSWDPFCLAVTKKPDAVSDIAVEIDGRPSGVTLKSYILPRKDEFVDDALRDVAKIETDLQGIYVYRENRLIHGPDWLRMWRIEPHSNLLRVDMSFDHTFDDAFQVDIKKSRILLNEQLFDYIKEKVLDGPRREANTRYRKGMNAVAKGVSTLIHAPSDSVIRQKSGSLDLATIESVDAATGTTHVSNNSGQTTAKVKIVHTGSDRQVRINAVDSLDDGALWEVSLIDGHEGITISTSHPFYQKAYLPNSGNTSVIQALDYLLWAVAQAELNNTAPEYAEMFEEFRFEVSRNLRKLVANLPDAPEPSSE